MTQSTFSPVKKGHIVPQVYQRSFAVNDQVAVHIDGRIDCVLMNIRDAATRPRFYRRTRPDGTEIDDIEASLSRIEDAVRPVFDDLERGLPLDSARKNVLAQFIGVQVARSPAFFEQDAAIIDEVLGGLDAPDFKSTALARFGGDVDAARRALREAYLNKTEQLTKMVTLSYRMASVIGHMRWQLVRFNDPLLAYSDHPVVMWPLDATAMPPFPVARFKPASAIEVRVPLSPDIAVLMTWADRHDASQPVLGTPSQAAELNAFTVSQAERQWMHRPGAEPTIATGRFDPLACQLDPTYNAVAAISSKRLKAAEGYLRRTHKKRFLSKVEMSDSGFA
jgi:hypothetical protein